MKYNSALFKKITGLLICFILLCSTPACAALRKPLLSQGYDALKQQLQTYVQSREDEGRIGVYFYDLKDGGSFGINEQEPFRAASSIKAPIVLYLFQQAADGEVNLEEKIAYQADTDYSSGAGVIQYVANDGDRYSLGLLANLAITLSDNIAWHMLERRLGIESIADYLSSLGGKTVYPEGKNISSAQDMGLYLQAISDFKNAEPEFGKLLINYMSHTIWDQEGLPAKIPDEIQVAHKVGMSKGVANDMGIVFLDNRPYILVVMTEGFADGFATIEEISEMVYNYQLQVLGL